MSGQSRREFLAVGAAGAVSVLGAASRAAEEKKPAKPRKVPAQVEVEKIEKPSGPLPGVIRLSVAAYSYRSYLDGDGKPGKMSLFDLTEMAAHWKLDAIEPTSYYFLKTDDEYLYALKRKVFLAGLEISGTPTNNDFCPNPGPEVEASKKKLMHWIDCSAKLGSPVIRVFAGKPAPGVSREESFKNVVAAFKEVSQHAAKRGVVLALENHGYMTETADDVLRIVDAVDNEWFSVNLDTGNFKSDPYAQIAQLAPRAVTSQIKIKVNEDGEQKPADIPRIVKILREKLYRGYVALEYEGADPIKEVPMYLEKIRAAMNG